MPRYSLGSTTFFLAAALAAGGQTPSGMRYDWPQWRGPERTAVSRETGLLQNWPEKGPPLAWSVKGLGEGYSTPTVADGRIFLMGNRARVEWVVALEEGTGKQLWSAEVGPVRGGGGGYPGPRCSPTADGGLIYALGLNGDLVCLEAAAGKERWRKDLGKDFGGSVGGWGYSESPLIDGDVLVCTPGGDRATLVALDKKTGDVIWRGAVAGLRGKKRPFATAAYSSAVVAEVDGVKQYVQFLDGGAVGVAAKDGKLLWHYDRPANETANCATPVYHDGHVFAASAYTAGGGLVKLTRQAGEFRAEEVYFTKRLRNQHGGVVLVDGYLYGSDEESLTCLEFKTGKVQWADRDAGKGSIAYADGRLYYRNEGGPIILAEANPRRYVECGRFEQPRQSGAPAWPHPVLANGKLYVRDQDVLLCYDVRRR